MTQFFDRPWDSQPQEAVEPSERWLERGLCHLVIGGRCIVSGQTLTLNGTRIAALQSGIGPQATAGTNIGASLASSNLLKAAAGLGDYTIGAFAPVPANGSRGFLVGVGDSAGTAGIREVYLAANANGTLVSSSGTLSFSTSAVNGVVISGGVDGAPKLYSGRRIGTTHYAQAGTSFASAVGNSTTIYKSAFKFFLGGYVVSSTYGLTYANVPVAFAFDTALTDAELLELNADPWQLFQPRRIYIPGAATGPATHAATGALATAGAAIAGSAARIAGAVSHAATGALSAAGAAIAGASARTRAHPATGALATAGAVIAGAAARSGSATTHAATGSLAAAGAALVGAAAHVAIHSASGALATAGASIAGSAARAGAVVTHAATGALVGDGATMTGTDAASAFIKYFDVLSGKLLILRAL